MAQLLDLPEEVVDTFILPHLTWNEILRCRRVCKFLKTVTEAFIRIHPEMAPEIEIQEDNLDRSLKAFLQLGIPTTKIFINNPSGHGFFDKLDNPTLYKFLRNNGPLIKSLRMKQFSFCPCFNEWTFLASLPSLGTFEADFIGFGKALATDGGEVMQTHVLRAQTDTRIRGLYLPENFKRLTMVKIGQTHPEVTKLSNIHDRVPGILKMFEQLDYISFPVNLKYFDYEYIHAQRYLRQSEHALIQMMKEFSKFLKTCKENGRSPVKYIDFENYHVDEAFRNNDANHEASSLFLNLCKQSLESGVKLLNVQPSWFERRLKTRSRNLKSVDLGIPIVSLVYFDPCVFKLNMPNLEKVDIRKTSPQSYSVIGLKGRLNWPSLKTLKVNVDLGSEVPIEQKKVLWLFDLFFKNTVRHQLTELCLSFESKLKVFTPKTEDIVVSCPNLKKLKISDWPGPPKELVKLWNGLAALEEVTLENCTGIYNKTFIGDDFGNPTFLKLKNLRKLTLVGLDQMPGITDTFFSLVLARMELTHLILSSVKPLINVTRVGIVALLKGAEFSGSIEKFPFHGWSVADLDDEEFQKLGKQFRSSQMM